MQNTRTKLGGWLFILGLLVIFVSSQLPSVISDPVYFVTAGAVMAALGWWLTNGNFSGTEG